MRGTTSGNEETEIVEEDAEDERLAEVSGGLPSTTTTTTASRRPPLWPADEIGRDDDNKKTDREDNVDSAMGVFPDGDEEQPSMDDFFHDQYDGPIDDEEEGRMDDETKTDKNISTSRSLSSAGAATPIVPPPVQTEKAELLLLTTKVPVKSKRPKIRPSAVRKKK